MARTCRILAMDGVADGSVGITLDILGAAARITELGLLGPGEMHGSITPRIVSLDGNPVRTASRRILAVDGALSLRRLDREDVVLVPGLGMATPEEIDAALARDDVVLATRAVKRAASRGAMIAASCSATFVLGAAGVLDDREATTTWWLGPAFARRFPRVTLRTDRMVVASGPALTAGSAFAQADLVLAIVARVSGPSLARLVSRYLILDERPSQARYMVTHHLRIDDPVVRALERFILANLDRALTVPEMARATATSARTLARKVDLALGTTPLRFAQRLKMERAVHLLETTDDPIETIAARVGYADAAAFRRILRRETGRAPREIRGGAGPVNPRLHAPPALTASLPAPPTSSGRARELPARARDRG